MTRFDAATPEDRRRLFAEAITAHRERASPFVTFEAHADARSADGIDDGEDETSEDDELEEAPPWVQFADGTLNLDCTDAGLEAFKTLLSEFPAFKIDDLTRPEEAEGVNVRVSALADPNRVSQCVEQIFREVYDQPEDFRVWVAEV
jgi:hypothetical protein